MIIKLYELSILERRKMLECHAFISEMLIYHALPDKMIDTRPGREARDVSKLRGRKQQISQLHTC